MPLIGPVISTVAGGVLVREHAVIRVDAADHRGARARRGGIIGDPEGHRLEAPARLRDRLDVGHAERGLDQDLEADPFLAFLRSLNLGHHHVHGIDIRRNAGFGDQDHVEARTGLDDIDNIPIHVMGIETVDADHHGLRAPVDVVQGGNDILAGLLLVVGGNGVLDIEKNNVRVGLGRFFEQSGIRSWDREFGAMQARRCLLDDGEAHVLVPLFLPLIFVLPFLVLGPV
ncbi:MAG: hypothetical protein USCAAHI_02641 [Beijerinckiaceae bacterium]|nr:MAG: hypothetical protein USCAAHI_02641 [Beijerinckiaceae bacterium]